MKNKNENPIDGLFRRKLNEEQLAPDDLLWNEIETKLAEKKPNRRFRLWFLLGALLLCGVASYFAYFNYSSNNSNVISAKIVLAENKNSDSETSLNTTSTGMENDSLQSNNTSTINSSSSVSKKSISTTSINNSSPGNKAASAKNYSIENSSSINKNSEKKAGNNSSTEIIKNDNPVVKNSGSVTDLKNENTISKTEISNSTSDPINETETSASDNSTNNTEIKKDEPTTTTQNQNPSNENSNSAEIKTLPDTAAIVNQKIIYAPPPFIAEKIKKWFVEIGSSVMHNKSKLSSSASSINQVQSQIDSIYFTNRNNNEKAATTFNYNFNIGMNIKNFQFKSGIDVMRIGENIEYDNRGLCFTVEGNPTLGYDTLQVHTQVNNTIGSRNGKSVNTYLGIPLQINYSIPLKILKLQFGIGGFASTPLKWNSYYLNKTVTGLENPFDLKMINTIVLGYSFNAGIAVPITKHFDAVLNYDFRHTMSPIEKTEYGTKKVFKSSGANISLRYNF